MTIPQSAGEQRRGATVAQLQCDIDSGLMGDKAPGFDPAAAPLGTDEEAAGTPPPPELVARERALERAIAPKIVNPNAATPELQPDGRLRGHPGVTLAALAGVATAAALGVLLFAAL